MMHKIKHNRYFFTFLLIAILAIFGMVCEPPTPYPTAVPPQPGSKKPENIQVKIVNPQESAGNIEEIPVPNCGGTGTLTRFLGSERSIRKDTSLGRSVNTTVGVEVAIPETVKGQLEAAIEATYAETLSSANSRVDEFRMEAAVGTEVVYKVQWKERKFSAIVIYEMDGQSFETLYTYTLIVPDLVPGGSYQRPCPPQCPSPTGVIQRFENVPDYVEEGMRACPKGYAMAGFHAQDNKVLCRRVMPVGEETCVETEQDIGIQRSGMHACPVGTYMRGVHVADNRYLCSWDIRRGQKEWEQEFDDRGTAGYGMHICPRQGNYPTYMTGLHVGANVFLCGVHYREDTP